MIRNWMLSLAQTRKKTTGSSWRMMFLHFLKLIMWTNLSTCDFNCIFYLMETLQLQNFVFSTWAEYQQRLAHICTGNAAGHLQSNEGWSLGDPWKTNVSFPLKVTAKHRCGSVCCFMVRYFRRTFPTPAGLVGRRGLNTNAYRCIIPVRRLTWQINVSYVCHKLWQFFTQSELFVASSSTLIEPSFN